jgi:hypothetical protein
VTDPAFVAGAYTIVIGGLSLYVVTIARRVRAARRSAESIERERRRDVPGPPAEAAAPLTGQPSEVPR